jgi:hypothetical protein
MQSARQMNLPGLFSSFARLWPRAK